MNLFFYTGIYFYGIIGVNLFCYSFFLLKRMNNLSCTCISLGNFIDQLFFTNFDYFLKAIF